MFEGEFCYFLERSEGGSGSGTSRLYGSGSGSVGLMDFGNYGDGGFIFDEASIALLRQTLNIDSLVPSPTLSALPPALTLGLWGPGGDERHLLQPGLHPHQR